MTNLVNAFYIPLDLISPLRKKVKLSLLARSTNRYILLQKNCTTIIHSIKKSS